MTGQLIEESALGFTVKEGESTTNMVVSMAASRQGTVAVAESLVRSYLQACGRGYPR